MTILRTKMSDFSPFDKGSEKTSVFYCFSIGKTKNQGLVFLWFLLSFDSEIWLRLGFLRSCMVFIVSTPKTLPDVNN